MEIPQDVGVVGWYRFGPSPGRPGSAILVGHVDSHAQGPGAFFRLAGLRMGASISVKREDGTRVLFKVVARRSYPKGRLPRRIFDRAGQPMLTLVTCGGSFDRRLRRYADNIVIFAVRASSFGV
jgi:sortase (surface protein transpeptidase)